MQFKFKVRKYVHTFKLYGLYTWFDKKRYCFKYGPAVIYFDGYQAYYLNGKRHREDGPAVIEPRGSQSYWLNGELHREDGPAVIYDDGTQAYCLNDQFLTKESWEKKINAI